MQTMLGLKHPPVAVAFRDRAPEGVPRVDAAGPSGCSYWAQAAEGRTFYTEAPDHYNCPIGSYTHGVELPPDRAKELEGLVGTMVGLEYIRMQEVPGIPRRAEPFRVAVYGPWPNPRFEADAVLVRGSVKQIMILAEAAHAAGVEAGGGVGLRPTCAAIPQAMQSGQAGVSLGCIGNRVYTGMEDGELVFAMPGAKASAVVAKLAVIVQANRELESFHRQRQAALSL
jgi:uncharacterized protein (DUF169 family)